MLPMAVARFSSSGVVIFYVRPVLSMTSYLLKSQEIARRRRPAEAQCTRSLGLGYKLCAVIPVAGQRTRLGTTFRVLKVTSQVATPGGGASLWSMTVLLNHCYSSMSGGAEYCDVEHVCLSVCFYP